MYLNGPQETRSAMEDAINGPDHITMGPNPCGKQRMSAQPNTLPATSTVISARLSQ